MNYIDTHIKVLLSLSANDFLFVKRISKEKRFFSYEIQAMEQKRMNLIVGISLNNIFNR